MLTAELAASRTVKYVGGTIISPGRGIYVVLRGNAVLCFWDRFPITVHILVDNFEYPAMNIWNDDNWEELINFLQSL